MVDIELVKQLRVAALGMLSALDLPGLGAERTVSARMSCIASDPFELDRVGVAESHLRAALDARPARMPWRVPGLTLNEKWYALASTFPSLIACPDILAFSKPIPAPSQWAAAETIISRIRVGMYGSGKGHAATFVLSLFRRAEWPVFDAVAAMGQWDAAHRAAFVAWASDPWWP